MGKHTQGPWAVFPANYNVDGRAVRGFHINGHGNRLILCDLVPGKNTDRTTIVCEANARMMAAAPEMLEALQSVRMHKCMFDTDEEFKSACNKVTAAIKKAGGWWD